MNIYGSLSGKLEFSRGENFLVGINGCGKTTVLNIIRWMLSPSLPDLCTLPHDQIQIEVKHGKYLYSIRSRIEQDLHELTVVTRDKSRDYKPIRTSLIVDPFKIRGDKEELKEQYRHLQPEPQEVATWGFILEELPSPVFIGLERSIGRKSLNLNSINSKSFLRTQDLSLPTKYAVTLMRDAFNTGMRKLVDINEELNRKVIELSFSGVFRGKFASLNISKVETLKKIVRLKQRFDSSSENDNYSKAFSTQGVRDAVVKYLDDLSVILEKEKKDHDLWLVLNQHNFERAAKMFDLFEEHEVKGSTAQREMSNFIAEVNRFLVDSGKSIHFDKNTGIPFFKSDYSSENLNVTELSSGEAQVVILLTYFAFLAKGGIPIIIDEPELSLHVQWQKNFVASVKEVMPKECQTIMATHSPEICGAENVNVQSIEVRS